VVTGLLLNPWGPVSASSCPRDQQNFQLYTGYVYSHPESILTTTEGVLELERCLEKCRSDPACSALNFETGLCVTFASSTDTYPELLSKSEFPVFTMYAELVCLAGCQSSPWALEVLPGYYTNNFFRSVSVGSRLKCATACSSSNSTAACRSSSYNSRTGECRLSSSDRLRSSLSTKMSGSPAWVYLETSCGKDRLCEVREVKGRILKTVDSVKAKVPTREECKNLCMQANFSCHSYDWGATGENICRLSHHSSSSIRMMKDAYLSVSGSSSYELGACYNVTVQCTGEGMVTRVSTSTLFNGKLYTKNRPHSCLTDVKESSQFELEIGYNDVNCDVARDSEGGFSAQLVIQHHDKVVTNSDIGLEVRCDYDLAASEVGGGLHLATDLVNSASREELAPPPNISLRISDRRGNDVFSAKVGDPLALRFEIDDLASPYELFVRELVAMDGKDTSEILLIDSRGCPTDYSILGIVQTVTSARTLQTNFDAFKFPTSDLVQFRALVTPCIPRCEPVVCTPPGYPPRNLNSYGRRRRRRQAAGSEEAPLLVANAMRIVDTFEFVGEGVGGGREGWDLAQGPGLPGTLVWIVLLACQVIVLLSWVFLCRRAKCDCTQPGINQRLDEYSYKR